MSENPFERPLKISWREGTNAPVCNVGENVVFLDGLIYMGGGREASKTPAFRIDRYNISTNSWNGQPIVTSFSWFSLTALNNKLVMVGGRDDKLKVTKKIFMLDGEKIKEYAEMMEPRFAAAAIGYQKYLIIVGGSNNEKGGPNNDITLSSTELFDSANGQSYLMNELLEPSWGLQSVIIEEQLFILGGMSKTKKPLQKVFTASLDTLSDHNLIWNTQRDTVWCRSYPVVMWEKYLLLVGGYNQTEDPTPVYTRTNEIQYFGDSTSVLGHIPFERSAPAAVKIDDHKLIVIGGKRNGKKNNFGYLTDTVWIGEVESTQ